jgi:SOS-response transcriptional repressor LexA
MSTTEHYLDYENTGNPWSPTSGHTGLTKASRRVLNALARVLDREGTASIREVGAEAGLSSVSSTSFQLHKLALYGYIEEPIPNRPRGWQLTERGWAEVPTDA